MARRNKVKLDLLIDTSLIVEKGIRGGTCHSIYRLQKVTTNT